MHLCMLTMNTVPFSGTGTKASNSFNISSSCPVTLLFFQLDECMCWHLQGNLVEPPNELQECLQNNEQKGIVFIVTDTQESESSDSIKP